MTLISAKIDVNKQITLRIIESKEQTKKSVDWSILFIGYPLIVNYDYNKQYIYQVVTCQWKVKTMLSKHVNHCKYFAKEP